MGQYIRQIVYAEWLLMSRQENKPCAVEYVREHRLLSYGIRKDSTDSHAKKGLDELIGSILAATRASR